MANADGTMKPFLRAMLPATLCLTVAFAAVTAIPAHAQNDYPLTADSQEQPGVPKGDVTYFKFTSAKVFPGTERDCWVYVPKQYDPKTPACVMVFQDGGGFQDRNGWRVPTVFDNLIAKGEMPVTIGIFLNPGVVPPLDKEKQLPRYNRSFEYDATDDRYVRFLTDEIFPELAKKYNLTSDPNERAICGASSGGIASFVAAWERPDVFRRVYGAISSFTDLRGGNRFPPFIRKTEPKPLRIFLQDGANDQDIYSGSWPIGNNDVAAALKFAGYDARYEVTVGGHDGRQGTALLPEALRFLWHDWKTDFAIKPRYADRQPVLREALIAGEEWTQVAARADFDGCLCIDSAGVVWATASKGEVLWKITSDDKVRRVARLPRIVAMTAAPGGKVYAVTRQAELISINTDGNFSVLRKSFGASSLTVDAQGSVFGAGQSPSAMASPLPQVRGDDKLRATFIAASVESSIALVPDQSLVLVAPFARSGKYVTSARIKPDGTLADAQEYHDLALVYGHAGANVSGMVCDLNGWLYVATEAGIQMLDQAGRVNGIILPPSTPGQGQARGLAWGGANHEYLYTTVGGKLYRRKTKARGVVSSEPPVKPPGPRL